MIILNYAHQNVSKRKEKQLSQWRYSMANIKTCQSCIAHFAPALIVNEILTFEIFELGENRSRPLGVNLEVSSFVSNGKYPNLEKSFCEFCANSHRFSDIKIWNFLPSKSTSRSEYKFRNDII